MKKLYFSLIVCLILISVAVFAFPGGHCDHSERMIKQLDLNDEQAAHFREVMLAKREEIHAYQESQYEETIEHLYSVLTTEQIEEFKQIRESRIQRKKEKCKFK